MFVTLIDPTKETLAVKAVKPVAGSPGIFTLVLADFVDAEGKLHVDEVFSQQPATPDQPQGSPGTRPPGTAGEYERCTVNGNVAVFRPRGTFIARYFQKVTGL